MPLDAARDAVIAMQATLIQALATENVRLAGQAADLAARLEWLASRNSGNSSMPPSAYDLPGRTPPRRGQSRERGKRKPGKQPGAPGSHLAWSEHPDDRVPHFPGGTCECGADLDGAADLGVTASHQQIEIPLAPARVIQHDLHAAACTCGRVHQAAAPAGAGTPGTVTYGLNLQAWCVFLLAAHAVPVHRCAELIEADIGIAHFKGDLRAPRQHVSIARGKPPPIGLPSAVRSRRPDP